ncbi:DivIVA domain-containing protein [Amycolatopsis sp. H20-H5]|uniref:DivIVA domain-containing protein n=1 Tax=Amycolatopsis sp. H20-H5 TaxID=3046309 RepID=UPI002DBDDB8D|nr:DivIVA domain-containing protein [Amycolatopsis sp. H20-H5]MEC3975990.1 DivIVA domain-containing protein [Amycolatopsis sp. H20-H5]
MTPEEVRETAFGQASLGTRGYREQDVDEFLKLLEQTLSGDDVLTANDVRKAAFTKAPKGSRGYDEAEVDAFLDLAEHALQVRNSPSSAFENAPSVEEPRKRWWQRG